jgi:hypothetical protein
MRWCEKIRTSQPTNNCAMAHDETHQLRKTREKQEQDNCRSKMLRDDGPAGCERLPCDADSANVDPDPVVVFQTNYLNRVSRLMALTGFIEGIPMIVNETMKKVHVPCISYCLRPLFFSKA